VKKVIGCYLHGFFARAAAKAKESLMQEERYSRRRKTERLGVQTFQWEDWERLVFLSCMNLLCCTYLPTLPTQERSETGRQTAAVSLDD